MKKYILAAALALCAIVGPTVGSANAQGWFGRGGPTFVDRLVGNGYNNYGGYGNYGYNNFNYGNRWRGGCNNNGWGNGGWGNGNGGWGNGNGWGNFKHHHHHRHGW